MNAVRLPREDVEYLARERADETLRNDDLRMAEIINEVADIWNTSWLTHALIHAHRTGDWKFVQKQCESHIEPALLDALERDVELARRAA